MGKNSVFWKKFFYFLDEAFVFCAMLAAVIFAELLKNYIKHDIASALALTWPKVIMSVIITVMCYGMLNESFKYNDREKPPIFKRLVSAILQGLGWRSLFEIPGF